MFTLYLVIQIVGIVILMSEIVYINMQPASKMCSLMTVFTICALINSIGYLLELLSTSKGEALMAVRFTYCGKVYILVIMFFIVMSFCKIRIPRVVMSVLIMAHTAVVVLVMLCERNDWYYSDITFVKEGTFPHLVTQRGLFYNLYLIMIVAYMLTMPCVCLWRYRKIKDPYEKRQLLSVILLTLLPTMGFIVYMTGQTGGYDTTAASYVLASIILMVAIFRDNILDILDVAKDDIVEHIKDGIVVYSNSNEVLYTNEIVADIFPDILVKYKQDQVLADMKAWCKEGGHHFFKEHVYRADIRKLYKKKQVKGHMIFIDDVTESFNYARKLELEVEEKTSDVKHIQHAIISSFADMIEARDGITGQHVKRTCAYVQLIAMGLLERGLYPDTINRSYIKDLLEAASLHDIGKISIPDAILQKSGALTYEEFEIIKTHTQKGAEMIEEILREVENASYLVMARDVAKYHHEKWNGKGYPAGLKGEEIPLAARIMAVSDVYDALMSKRSYKEALTKEKSLQIMRDECGVSFDPTIASVFIEEIQDIPLKESY